MGEVYRADDLELGQSVALKFLPPRVATDPAELGRLRNEVRVARQIAHPNVCRIYDIGAADSHSFLTMEYVDGEDLASVLRRMGRPSKDKALEIARQLCLGLAAAHDAGVLHRDLKPANVMIDGRGRVRITDFGLAGLAEELEQQQHLAGTPAYMAPEQLTGGSISARSDIYALGLILHEIFTGRRVHDTNNLAELKQRHASVSAVTSTGSLGEIDPAVEAVVLRCLERDPRQRPSTAYAVLGGLPGGDPLTAALAAGETPSPEMVAEARVAGGLRPTFAGLALAGVVAALIMSLMIAGRVSLNEKIPLDLSPQELTLRATAILGDLGIEDLPPHRRWGFDADRGYLGWVAENDDSPERWDSLAKGRPPAARFWFRYSSEPLEPGNVHAFGVSLGDPPQHASGSGTIQLDTTGKLDRLAIIPDRWTDAGAIIEPFDWSALFEAAGLDPAAFTETERVKTPDAPCDDLRAWTGPAYGDEIETTVQAGALAGNATYFEILGPWSKPVDRSQTVAAGVVNTIGGFIVAGVIIAAIVLARRNMKMGRSDRKGAFRLVLFFLGTMLASWLLTDFRLQTLDLGSLFANLVFGRPLAHAMLHGVLAWVLYVAIEPYVRRLWPESMVSWTRLLMGRFRDPLVGRDILVGMGAMGFMMAATGSIFVMLTDWANIAPPQPDLSGLTSLLVDLRETLASILNQAQSAVYVPMAMLVLVLLLRMLLRRTWIAVVVVVSLVVVVATFSPQPDGTPTSIRVAGALFAAAIPLAFLTLLLRFGLLAVMGGFFLMGLMGGSLTLDTSRWYAGNSIVVILAILALAGWSFYISLAGRSLFKDSLLEE
jgi:serine/threonine-protein kinase